MLGKSEDKEEEERTEDEMVGWHHQFNGHEFEQALGDGEGQGGLVCCSPWGHRELDTTERLNSNNKLEGYRFPRSQLWYYSMILFPFGIQAEGAPPFMTYYSLGREKRARAGGGMSLVAQGLRLCVPNAGGPGSIPGQGTRSHMLQLRPSAVK